MAVNTVLFSKSFGRKEVNGGWVSRQDLLYTEVRTTKESVCMGGKLKKKKYNPLEVPPGGLRSHWHQFMLEVM